jgi:hypothetical protein
MGKRRDYNDYIDFVLKNTGLTRTEVWEKYKAEGGHIQKKRALDLYRDAFELKVSEDSKRKTFEIMREKGGLLHRPEKPIDIIHPQDRKKKQAGAPPAPRAPKAPIELRPNYYRISERVEYDTEHPLSKRLLENIQELYGIDDTRFISISTKVGAEGSMNPNWNFRFFLPYGKTTRGVKSLFTQLCSQADTYYGNLLKRYGEEKGEEIEEAQNDFREAARELRAARGLTMERAAEIMQRHGIKIGSIQEVDYNTQS